MFIKKIINSLEFVANNASRWIGSISSILIHTVLFIFAFALAFFGFNTDKILLIVTTIVSLEAIYLAIFIQMSVNQQSKNLKEVAQDIDEIQEDVDEIQEDVEEIQVDVDEIQEDVEGIEKDIEQEEIDKDDQDALDRIQNTLAQLTKEITELKKK